MSLERPREPSAETPCKKASWGSVWLISMITPGRNQFGSMTFGSGLLDKSCHVIGSVRFGQLIFPVRCGSACVLWTRGGSVRFCSVRFRVRFRPVPELNNCEGLHPKVRHTENRPHNATYWYANGWYGKQFLLDVLFCMVSGFCPIYCLMHDWFLQLPNVTSQACGAFCQVVSLSLSLTLYRTYNLSLSLAIHIYIYIYVSICTCVYIYIYIYTYIYTHTHTYLHTWSDIMLSYNRSTCRISTNQCVYLYK